MKNLKEHLNKEIPPKDIVAAFVCVAILILSLVAIHFFDFEYLSAIKKNSYLEILFLLSLGEILNIFYRSIRKYLK